MLKSELCTVATIVSWCGHANEHAIFSEEPGWALLVPVLGEAT
jgi:hypothetical protein